MKKYGGIILLAAIVGIVVLFGLKAAKKRQDMRSHNRQFYAAQHKDFLAQMERRDRIRDAADYTKEQQETTQRYEELKGTEQVIWGRLVPAEEMELTDPLRMSARRKGPQGRLYPSIVVDDQMRFAFSKVDPGTYDIILYETSNHPGMRVEDVIVEEG